MLTVFILFSREGNHPDLLYATVCMQGMGLDLFFAQCWHAVARVGLFNPFLSGPSGCPRENLSLPRPLHASNAVALFDSRQSLYWAWFLYSASEGGVGDLLAGQSGCREQPISAHGRLERVLQAGPRSRPLALHSKAIAEREPNRPGSNLL